MKNRIPCIFYIFIFITIYSNTYSQTNLISNVKFTVDSTQVKITYELDGDVTKEYEVYATMRNINDGSVYSLSSAKGDIGKGKFAGLYNTIYWEYRNDYEIIPNTTDFEFNVTANEAAPINQDNTNTRNNTKKESSGGSTWYYYVGGAVVVIVALALTVFSSDNKDDGGDEIPAPPTRP